MLNRVFHDWAPYKGAIPGRRQGVLISMEDGTAVAFALFNLEDRGKMFINPQDAVYQGMIIGEHSRDNDLEVNPLKGKKLTNVRASGTDDAVKLTPPTLLSLEQAISYIDDDELVEVTPKRNPAAQALSRPARAQAPVTAPAPAIDAPSRFSCQRQYLCARQSAESARHRRHSYRPDQPRDETRASSRCV